MIEAGVRGAGYARLRAALQDRQPFRTSGALRAGRNEGKIGELRGPDLDQFYADANKIEYVVYSYQTPIAWSTADHDHFVEQRFSITTSRHQGVVRAWLGNKID